MPDLSGLPGRTLGLALFKFFLPGLGIPDIEGSHALADFRNAARLTDKAISEYELARTKLRTFAGRESNEAVPLSVYLAAVNHLETCINALHRAAILFNRLKAAQRSTSMLPSSGRPPVPAQLPLGTLTPGRLTTRRG
jgi:hypothetical protein